MLNVLIDTCVWRILVSKKEISEKLILLKRLTSSKEINLLVPLVLKEEWEKHRNIELTSAEKTVVQHEKTFKDLYGLQMSKSQKTTAVDSIRSQVHIIDELFILGTLINEESSTLIKAAQNSKAKKAPFRTKSDSMKDAILIFSALDYLSEKETNELIFVSDNYTDFAVEIDGQYQLHPDILGHYLNVNVTYFKSLNEFIDFLKVETGIGSQSHDVESIQTSQSNIFNIDTSSDIIEQLDKYVLNRYSEISFYPLLFLKKDVPFKLKNNQWTHYSLFTLQTGNKDIITFFRNLNISENTISLYDPSSAIFSTQDEMKLKNVLRILNSNLIFYLADNERKYKIDIRFQNYKHCDCSRCNYNRFLLGKALPQLKINSGDDERTLLKKAFVNYQFGNYITAVEIIEVLAARAKSSNRLTTYFIAKFNLTKLKIFIENNYWGKDRPNDLLVRLGSINLADDYKIARSNENGDFIEWLYKNSFYNESFTKLQLLCNEIRHHYQLQTEGGFTSNNEIWSLINEFAEIESFLNQNFIIYDSFQEFNNLFEIFLESVIASHAIPESQGSKLSYLDDYILKKIAHYASANFLQEVMRRYNLQSLKYNATSPEPETFLTVSYNFLENYQSTMLQIEEFDVNSRKIFLLKYNRIFSNIVFLFTALEFDNSTRIRFSEKLLDYLCQENVVKDDGLNYVRGFFWKNYKILTDALKLRFIKMILENKKYYDEYSFKLGSVILSSRIDKSIPNEYFNDIVNICFNGLIPKSSLHSIVYFYDTSNSDQKATIRNLVEDKIDQNFDYDLYYFAVIYDVLSDHVLHFEKFYEQSFPEKNVTSFRTAFIDKNVKRFNRLNTFINVALKLNLDFKSRIFEPIKAFDPYYEWLCDLNDFDYSQFNPFWVAEYRTSYYDEHFKSSDKLRESLASYLKATRNSIVQESYFEIYGK